MQQVVSKLFRFVGVRLGGLDHSKTRLRFHLEVKF